MTSIGFEWDRKKENKNIKKYGISFDEVKTAFYDKHAVQYIDPDHSDAEGRFLL